MVRDEYMPKSYSSSEIIKFLEQDGGYFIKCVGDHHQFKHPTKPGKVTITHPKKDIPLGTIKSMEKQNGIVLLKESEFELKSSLSSR